MIQFKRILVPLDFAEPSRRALSYGLALATQFKAKLIVAHIVPEASALTYAFPVETAAIEKEQSSHAAGEIQKLVSAGPSGKLDVQTIVRTGRIDDELLRIVEEEAVDLVVMGTHGRRYPGRWLIGSVAERMLRKVPVPVVTMSHLDEADKARTGLGRLRRILYGADLWDSGQGLKYAVELAEKTGAKLTVVHVVDFVNLVYEAAVYVEEGRTGWLENIRKRLDEAVALENPAGMPVETLILEGKPYQKILALAKEKEMDMIVLNLQSKGILERAFIGSTAERVVRLAEVPVFSVPVSQA